MNFVNQLEDHLRDLSAEARKNHPGVKEASERAILKLRSLQNEYVTAVRKAANSGEKHPSTRLFRSSDLLHPFLLAANYPNASPKLLDTSFKAMKMLLDADAICPGDGTNMVRVWMIQAQVVVSYSMTKDTGSKSALGAVGLLPMTAMALSSKELNKSQSSIASNGGVGNASNTNLTPATSSSWFGSYFSSNPALTTNSVVTKTSISSTHGNAGSGHLNAKDLEKLALDILSCLLQLLEIKNLPVSDDQWTQSVTLCCLLYLPSRQNVRQAAHSTLPQVLSLLLKNENASRLKVKTWDDLLSCVLGMSSNATTGDAKLRSSSNSQMKRISKISSFHGVFSNCRFGDHGTAQPPSQALALELMTTLLPEVPSIFDEVGQKTFGVLVQVLQNHWKSQSKSLPIEVLRALQFALVVLQTQDLEWPAECRELIGRLIQPISSATEALRKQVDFEDGYIYKVPNEPIPANKSPPSIGNKYNIDTIQGLPQTVLWKAALSAETLKIFIDDKKSCNNLLLHKDVATLLFEAISDFCTIGASCENHMNMLIIASQERNKNKSLAYAAEILEKLDRWHDGKFNNDSYILGDALWAGFKTLLLMIDQLDESILEQTFAPSLAVLQHYLKRFPASHTIVERSLEGYSSLAKVSLKITVLRGALLSSLCKLSLPQWGKKDASSLLKDHNVAALLCLLNIVHRYKDQIGTDWLLILQTFEELSVVAIASPELSNNSYAGALSISATYARFASFSTCLSDQSLSHFATCIKDISLSERTPSAIPSFGNGNRNFDKTNSSRFQENRGPIGEKLMNIGARAIGWNSDSNDYQEDVPVADRTKNSFYGDYKLELDNRLAASRYPIRSRRVPFCVALLADVAMANGFRQSRCGSVLFHQICAVATEVPSFRSFYMDLLAMLVVSHVMEDASTVPAPFFGPGKIVCSDPRQNQLLAAERVSSNESMQESISQINLLSPLCEYIANSKIAVAAQGGLEALYTILESTGHKLKDQTWVRVVEAIGVVPSREVSSSDWTAACQVGFRCLKLIVDDFLEDAAKSAKTALLDCCSTFGSARHDLNTSLTAIGLLWTIADQDSGTESVDRALAKLVLLSGDLRAEVRNCAVNTLFSCIVGRGSKFTGEQWESCICKTIFGVYNTATSDTTNISDVPKEESSKKKSRYQVNVHHSRDSADKQWVATQALVLKGMCRLLRNFFNPLLKTTDDENRSSSKAKRDTPWFDNAWTKILGWAYDASIQVGGRDTLDLRNSGVELMVLCIQLACAAGAQAAITPATVGANMEVINGALRNVGAQEASSNESTNENFHSPVVEMWRENLFLDSFDVLESFREHLESESTDSQSGLLEPTQIQVLTKLASELSKLYDCCEAHEFKEDLTLLKYSTFEPLLAPIFLKPGDDDAMVVRFVRIVKTIATVTSSGRDARFLSQAQRACMEILKSMASNGSPEALFNLTVFSKAAFYAQRDPNDKCKKGVDIVSHEMSIALLDAYKSKKISDACRVLVVARLLSLFLSDNHGLEKKDMIGTSYKMLTPIIQVGLESAKNLAIDFKETHPAISNLLDDLWGRICWAISQMLSPTQPSGSQQLSFLNPSDLVDIVTASVDNAPSSHSSNLCAVYNSGASKYFEMVKTAGLADEEIEHILNLSAACFSGMCKVKPQDGSISEVAGRILTSASQSLELAPTDVDLNVRSAIKICEALQTSSDIDIVVIAVFSELSQLVAVEERSMRRAAGSALARANVRGVLDNAENRYNVAEERAREAERRVLELEMQIVELRRQNEIPSGILLLS